MKTRVLNLLSDEDAKARVAGKSFLSYGEPECWKKIALTCSESEQWNDVTEAMQVPHGVVLRTRTTQKNGDGTYHLTDAMVFLPALLIVHNEQTGLFTLVMAQTGPFVAPPQAAQAQPSPAGAPNREAPNFPNAHANPMGVKPQAPPPPPGPIFPNARNITITEDTPGHVQG